MKTSLRHVVRLTAIVLSLLSTVPVAAEVLVDTWYSTSIDDKRVGYLHERRETDVENGTAVVRTSMTTIFTIRRMDAEMTVESNAVFVETVAGEALHFESRNRLSSNDYQIRAERRGDVFIVTQEAMGQVTETEIPYSTDILFPNAIEQRIATTDIEPGGQLVLRTFSPDLARPTRMTIEYKGFEDVALPDGKTHRLERYESTQDLVPGIRLVEWRDEAGLVRSELPLLGANIVSVRSTREHALLPPESVELMISTLVDPGALLAHPSRITRARFVLGFASKELANATQLPRDSRQRLLSGGDRERTIEVTNERWPVSKNATDPDSIYLRASSTMQLDDPRVRQLAQQAGRSGSPEEVAGRIARWVHTAIEKKTLSVGFATAAEVARELRGDCTEHAVLTAALARVRGIPARVAVGLVYLNGVFGYHMWTEVFVGGWRSVDAALGQDAIDATHIKLATSSLANGFVDEELIAIVQLISSLSIRVLEYDLDGKTYTPSSIFELGKIQDGRYSNPLLGLRVEPSTGWTLLSAPTASTSVLLRAAGPDELTGEIAVTTIGYGFNLDEWVAKHIPDATVKHHSSLTVGHKSGRRLLLDRKGASEAFYAFFDRETMYTARLGPLSDHSDAAIHRFIQSIGIE